MYTLYYLNKNLQIHTIKVDSLNFPILIPEDLIFCDLRKDIHFIKEPDKCIDFNDIERLFMQSEFNDINLIKEADYRKQNTYLDVLCQVDYDKPFYDSSEAVPYIVFYESTGDSPQIGKVHFNMPMPAHGLYELEESYDNGVTWYRMTYYCSADENLEIPEYPGSFVDVHLIGTSELPMCNNSMYLRVYQDNQLIRIKKDGRVVSQESYYIKYK